MDSFITDDLDCSQPVLEIDLKEIQRDSERSSSFSCSSTSMDYDFISSYNWLRPADETTTPKPIIVVPGAPRIFTPFSGGQLIADISPPYADENRYFYGEYPLEPLFRSVLMQGYEPLAFQTLDLVTDRYNLRLLYDVCKLIRPQFINGNCTNNGDCSANSDGIVRRQKLRYFRIDVARIGQRLVAFEQKSTVEYYRPPRVRPIYGTDFEKRCTKNWSPLTRGTFQTVIKYSLDDDLCCLVRMAADCADGWMENDEKTVEEKMAMISLKPEQFSGSHLSYINFGCPRRDYDFVELTTKYAGSAAFPDYLWDQMYFGRVPAAYVGWHDEGYCDKDKLQRLSMNDVRRLMTRTYDVDIALRMQCRLLKRIINLVRLRRADERFAIIFDPDKAPGCLKFFSVNSPQTITRNGILPPQLKSELVNRRE